MNGIKRLIIKANTAYLKYGSACDNIAIEAQKYIDWDDRVGCQYFPADGLCIMATMPDGSRIYGLSECVCSVHSFFDSIQVGNKITPEEFKSISI